MRLLKMSGLALAAALVACSHNAEAPPAATNPVPPPAPADQPPVPPRANATTPVVSPPPPGGAAPGTAAPGAMGQATPPAAEAPPPPVDPNEEADAVASLREHHRHHHGAGVLSFVAISLDTLNVDEAQRAQLEQIRGELHAAMKPAHEAEGELNAALADGIAKGKVETRRVDKSIEKIEMAGRGVHEASVDSLNKLHELLTPQQRIALADKVQAHWAVWRKLNHEMEMGGREKEGRLQALSDELGLTPEQTDKIAAQLKAAGEGRHPKWDPAEAEAHVQAFTDAFAQPQFDAHKLGKSPGMMNGKMAAHGAWRMVQFYEVVAPNLTPEQRTQLVADLREHAAHNEARASADNK